MKTKLALSAVVAAVAVFSQSAFAQTSTTTREARKEETKAAVKAGATVPAGEALAGQGKGPSASGPTDKTRAERKTETKMARDAGTLKPAGEASHKVDDNAEKAKSAGTMKTRADRKEETKAAVKAGTTVPAGEATPPAADVKPKK